MVEQTKENDEEKVEIDPTWPLTPGGTGPARSCKWRGGTTPFHDGGCLSSPGRWPWGKRRYPEGRWKELRRELEEKVTKFAGGENELQKECFRMMSGERGCSLVQDEDLLEELRSILRRFTGKSQEETQAEAGQPFRLELIKSLLEDAGDPDCQFLEKAKTGLPVGVLEELERTPESVERQTKWALEDDPTVEAELHRENYPSAEEHEEHLRSHLEKEVEEGLVLKMSEKEFVEKYGNHRAVAALAVLVEDELTGKKRVTHDATHGVRVNNRIRCKLEQGGRMQEVEKDEEITGGEKVTIWTDAKATEEMACIGGWLDRGEGEEKAEWFSLRVEESWAPWIMAKGRNPKRVIAALELLGTLIAVKLWGQGGGKNINVKVEAFTDNKGNSYALKKAMSTKFPLTLLVMELAEEMRANGTTVELSWIRRDENQGADDLTNENFEKFDEEKRVHLKGSDIRWRVMDELMEGSMKLYEEVRKMKEDQKATARKFPSKKKGGGNPKKILGKW